MYAKAIEITNRFGIEVVICGNDEALCDALHIDHSEWSDAATEIVEAISDNLFDATGELCECSTQFRDWHGKHWDARIGKVACRTLTREIEVDEDGDEFPGEWKWTKYDKMPAEAKNKIIKLLNDADDAGIAAAEKFEAESIASADEAE